MKRTHGRSRTNIYRAWCAMVRRCCNPSAPDFSRYGGRGIKVCAKWMTFEGFFADMGEPPAPGYSIDRRENDGDYNLANCRWATAVQQQNNKRNNRLVSYRGEQMTVADAARAGAAGVSRETVGCRLRGGWAVEAAVETPLAFRRDKATRKIIREAA